MNNNSDALDSKYDSQQIYHFLRKTIPLPELFELTLAPNEVAVVWYLSIEGSRDSNLPWENIEGG